MSRENYRYFTANKTLATNQLINNIGGRLPVALGSRLKYFISPTLGLVYHKETHLLYAQAVDVCVLEGIHLNIYEGSRNTYLFTLLLKDALAMSKLGHGSGLLKKGKK